MKGPVKKSTATTIANSPGFWMAVFCLFGLLMLSLNDSKIQRRMQRMSYRNFNAIGTTQNPTIDLGNSRSLKPNSVYSLRIVYAILWIGATIGIVAVVRAATTISKPGKGPADPKPANTS